MTRSTTRNPTRAPQRTGARRRGRSALAALAAVAALAVLIPAWLTQPASPAAANYNDFDVSNAAIPRDEIHRGGPPRDGIPALDRPDFVAAGEEQHLDPDSRVLGLKLGGEARAYPITILNWHEIVNDRVGDRPVLISYCPLCGSGVAFDARLPDGPASFGVSGLLYNSDLLLYDRGTESLWSQILGEAVAGPLAGTRLSMIPLELTAWSDWRERHPDTRVLSRDTGFRRDYDRDPYGGYADSRRIYFPVARQDRRYHPKESVLGIEVDGRYKAYPFSELARATGARGGAIEDRFGGRSLKVYYDPDNHSARIRTSDGEPPPAMHVYWFAWSSFHPDTEVYRAAR